MTVQEEAAVLDRRVRSVRFESQHLRSWIDEKSLPTPNPPKKPGRQKKAAQPKYTHRLFVQRQMPDGRTLRSLQDYIDDALRDAIREICISEMDIVPFTQDPLPLGELRGYPRKLPEPTLLGYLGEIMAGAFAEALGAHDNVGWWVPAYFFRYHDDAFHYLRQNPDATTDARSIWGRRGDDVVALRLGEAGEVQAVLIAEAKCLSESNTGKIKEAHEQLSRKGMPVGLDDLFRILRHYPTDPDALKAKKALQELLKLEDASKVPRYDLLMYMTGKGPVRTESWIDRGTVSADYTGGRSLEVVEFHAEHLPALIEHLLRRNGAS